jgi:hypothetical protein
VILVWPLEVRLAWVDWARDHRLHEGFGVVVHCLLIPLIGFRGMATITILWDGRERIASRRTGSGSGRRASRGRKCGALLRGVRQGVVEKRNSAVLMGDGGDEWGGAFEAEDDECGSEP